MVTHLTMEDVPEPWYLSKKTPPRTERRKTSRTKVAASEDTNVENMQVDPRKRGRPPGKSRINPNAASKGVKKTRPLPKSAVDVLLDVSQNSVADVEALRRRRVEDAEACGRTVRTISPHQKRRISPTLVGKNQKEYQRCNGSSSAGPSAERACTPNPSPIMYLEEEEGKGEQIHLHRPSKEPTSDDVEDVIAPPVRNESLHRRIEKEFDSRSNSDVEGGNVRHRPLKRDHGQSRTKEYYKEHYEGRQIELSESSEERHFSYRKGNHKSLSRSPVRNFSRKGLIESWSPRQSHTKSPLRRREGCPDNSGHDYRKYYDYPSLPQPAEDYRKSCSSFRGGHERERECESSSSEHSGRHAFRQEGRICRQSSRTPYYSMSPTRASMNCRDSKAKEWTDLPVVKHEDIVNMSPASDRRRRRHKQALLDADTSRREGKGNKPFYLTLDPGGRPYGAGRPSWIAEINKLAIGLDPSCTHIKKQSFKDVQTFKNRLDDKFEYSGSLNEDHLRALMGKAVTKRRSELIALIKNSGKEVKAPVRIDHIVWCRLENLANSKQRGEKSEQGRYANACRITLGRTGCQGVDGVQEKLRSLLGRSPDPSEVEEEMQRDKGYGGQKRKTRICVVKEEKNCGTLPCG